MVQVRCPPYGYSANGNADFAAMKRNLDLFLRRRTYLVYHLPRPTTGALLFLASYLAAISGTAASAAIIPEVCSAEILSFNSIRASNTVAAG